MTIADVLKAKGLYFPLMFELAKGADRRGR